jgi:GNAT superfamily N-acetyltransferase
MELRPATPADFEAELRVLDAAEGGLRKRHGFGWRPPPLDAFANAHAYMLETDPSRSWLAEEDGVVVAYAAAWERDGHWFLSDLFVHPDVQARGVGTRLLELAWGDGPERRMTLADAVQPVSNAMYARRGLVPATPMLELGGTPRVDSGVLEPTAPEPAALAAVDAAAYGFDRAGDHVHWSRVEPGTAWLRGGEPVAYSYGTPSGRIGPVAGVDPPAAVDALRSELARAEGEVSLDIPGSARDLVEAALAAGLRITGPPGLLLLSRGLEPPRALVISGYWLL